MPRRNILTSTERTHLYSLPENEDDLIRYYTLNESDLSLVRQRRGDGNRLGLAIQLCLLRYPGYALLKDTVIPKLTIQWIAEQIQVEATTWSKYGVL